MDTDKLIKDCQTSYLTYRERCMDVAMEAQKYIQWDGDIGCEYIPGDGVCILATVSKRSGTILTECVCPADMFFKYVKGKESISEYDFLLLCI